MLLLDGHVHFNDCFDQDAFLHAACSNFQAAADEIGATPSSSGCMFFTEGADDQSFRAFRDRAGGSSAGAWCFGETEEDHSLIASHEAGGRLILIAGRQIATAEGLEVLALGADTVFSRGLGLREAISQTADRGAIAVIPYGFGKWWFRRGRLVRELLETAQPGSFFLGDNGGRLRFAGRPGLFELAESRRILTLPGSDPLPFPDQVGKVGSYGFVLSGEIDCHKPAQDLLRRIRALTAQPQCYGRREALGRFCRNQLAMQLRKFRHR